MILIIPLNSGRILVNGSSFYCGNSTSGLCQLALKTDIPEITQYVHPTEKQCNYAYTHPTAKQCNYTYTHPTSKQCNWEPDLSSIKRVGIKNYNYAGNPTTISLDFTASAILFSISNTSYDPISHYFTACLLPGDRIHLYSRSGSLFSEIAQFSSNGRSIVITQDGGTVFTGRICIIYFS